MFKPLFVAALLAAPLSATARAEVENTTTKPVAASKLSVLVSPIHLFLPVVRVVVEYQATERLSVAGIVGGGRRSIGSTGGLGTEDINGTNIVVGAQARYYFLGSYRHRMNVGAEVLYDSFLTDEPLPGGVVSVAAGGTHLGSFLGYKFIAGSGFTVDLQAGVKVLAIAPTPSGSGPHFTIETFSDVVPLANFNLGWTF